ncbi:U3 small nucleolar ribonucleoprotein protein imp4, partial [Striga asiatica]
MSVIVALPKPYTYRVLLAVKEEMLRRNVRLGREYLYRKSFEGKEHLLYEKKHKIREAFAESDFIEQRKPIPAKLRNEEGTLRPEIDPEDENTIGTTRDRLVPCSTVADKYANAADRDPTILLTTSRHPSSSGYSKIACSINF